MNRNTRLIFIVCIVSLSGVLALQLFWIRDYYHVNRERFEKEVNLAFEDAVKTEFRIRCDTLEDLLFRFLMDTAKISITSKWDSGRNINIYRVANLQDPHDAHSFHLRFLNRPILSPRDPVKQQVAHLYARTYRQEDLERHVIYFDTQNLGEYIGNQAEKYNFDTTRLRPIYTRLLKERGINEPFTFYLREEDSTMNRSRFPDSLQRSYPVITKSFSTYKLTPGSAYVRALFPSSTGYLVGKMTGIVLASALLLGIVAWALYYLLHIIRREKKGSEIKNDFIANISHELKTPIATVTAAIEALKEFQALEDPARAKRYLDISGKELQRLADMVNKILNLSLYERQQVDYNLDWVNIDAVVGELMGNHSLSAEKKINFQYRNEAGVEKIKTDLQHLYNMLNNLLDNAVKYSGDQPTIDIRFYREKEYYIIAVKDDGIGIARTDLPFVFDKFYRVPAATHKIKGYGLGLGYVRYIMQQQGGWCTAESSPGKGSIFKLGFKA